MIKNIFDDEMRKRYPNIEKLKLKKINLDYLSREEKAELYLKLKAEEPQK